MNKNYLFIAMSALALAGCSSDDLADGINPGGNTSADETPAPIVMNARTRNMTRAGSLGGLETQSYNFGAYAYKVSGSDYTPIMGNFLVGYSQEPTTAGNDAKGYSHEGSKMWAGDAGSTADHKSPWFYDGLGSSEYNYAGTAGYYTKAGNKDKMSAVETQPIVYWDNSTDNTDFYCYAPYDNKATFDYGTKTLTVTADPATFLYAATSVPKASYNQDITNLVFKHADAKIRLAFYSDIPGYRVELCSINTGNATFVDGTSEEDKGASVVATPTGTYTPAGSQEIKVAYNGTNASLTFGGTATRENLRFKYSANGLENFSITPLGKKDATTFNVIPEKATSGQQGYVETELLGVTPSADGNPSFTLHVNFKLISKTTGEEITVYNARVAIPAADAKWESNKRYTYIFHITPNANGSTDKGTTIDLSNADVPTDPALAPIVFDGTSISDYEDADNKVYDILPSSTSGSSTSKTGE